MNIDQKLYKLGNKSFLDLAAEFAFAKYQHAQQRIFILDSATGDDSYGGRKIGSPVKTLQKAYDLCTDSRGDMILTLPTHSETLGALVTASKIGVQMIGIKQGNKRPTFAISTAVDGISLTAAGQLIEGFEFAVPGIDAVTADINIAAADCVVRDTLHHGSTTDMNKVDIITLTAAADDALLEGVKIYNTTVEVVGGISIEGALSRLEVSHCFIMDSIGFTSGAIYDSATALQLFIHDSVFSNKKADTVVMEFGNNCTGVVMNCFINGRHTTIASNVTAGTGMNFYMCRAVEEAAKNAISIPVDDAE